MEEQKITEGTGGEGSREAALQNHFAELSRQGQQLRATFPEFDLAKELENPMFVRLTHPSVGVSVEDAYHMIHRKRIQAGAVQAAVERTARQLSNAVQAGALRPNESGSGQAPSVTSLRYRDASREQRDALKKRILEAAARGEKVYPK